MVCGARKNTLPAQYLIMALSLLSLATPAWPFETSDILVRFSEGRLTVKATDTSLRELLEALEEVNISVDLKDEKALAESVNVEVDSLAVELALEQMLAGFNLAYFYENGRLRQVIALRSVTSSAPAKPAPRAAKPPPRVRKTLPDFDDMLERDRASGLKAIKEALSNPDPDVRKAAVEAMGHDEGREVIPILIDAMRDSDPSIRIEAIEALAEKGELQPVKRALADPDEEVRDRAVDLLEAEGEIPPKIPPARRNIKR